MLNVGGLGFVVKAMGSHSGFKPEEGSSEASLKEPPAPSHQVATLTPGSPASSAGLDLSAATCLSLWHPFL